MAAAMATPHVGNPPGRDQGQTLQWDRFPLGIPVGWRAYRGDVRDGAARKEVDHDVVTMAEHRLSPEPPTGRQSEKGHRVSLKRRSVKPPPRPVPYASVQPVSSISACHAAASGWAATPTAITATVATPTAHETRLPMTGRGSAPVSKYAGPITLA